MARWAPLARCEESVNVRGWGATEFHPSTALRPSAFRSPEHSARADTSGVHPDVRVYVGAAVTVSVAVGIAGSLGVLHGCGVLAGSDVRWPFILFGAASLFAAFLGTVVVPRWYSRSTGVVATVTPERARIRLEIESDSDSTSLYGTILDCADLHPPRLRLVPS